jgi:hypothetical protein
MLHESEGVFTGINRFNTFSARIDYHISNNDAINGRFNLTRNFTDDIGASNVASPSISTTLTTHDQTGVVTWTHSFSGSVINQLRGQFSPNNLNLTAPPEPAVTGLVVSGLAGFGRYFGAPYDVTQDRYQIEDNLTWVKGNHTFKFGGSYRPATYDFENDLWFAGEWQFQSSAVYPITLAVPAADGPPRSSCGHDDSATEPTAKPGSQFAIPLSTRIQQSDVEGHWSLRRWICPGQLESQSAPDSGPGRPHRLGWRTTACATPRLFLAEIRIRSESDE